MVAAGHRASMNLSVQHKNGVSQICVSHLKWALHSLRIASLIGLGGTPISSLHPNVLKERCCTSWFFEAWTAPKSPTVDHSPRVKIATVDSGPAVMISSALIFKLLPLVLRRTQN